MKKKKLHTGNAPIGGKASKSRRVARRVTSQYHEIRNKIAAIEADNSTKSIKLQKQQKLQLELHSIGGIDAYQQASVISTQHFNTSKWITKTLCQLIHDNKIAIQSNNTSPKVLEVGAINTTLKMTKWLNVRAIDINSQHSSIEECDFFTIEPIQEYDIIVCSMVVNCVPEPERRGEMLCRLVEQFHHRGVLFLVLPLRCINSSAVGMIQFESLLSGLGCVELIPKRCTPHLVFYVLGKSSSSSSLLSSSSSSSSVNMGIESEYEMNQSTECDTSAASTATTATSASKVSSFISLIASNSRSSNNTNSNSCSDGNDGGSSNSNNDHNNNDDNNSSSNSNDSNNNNNSNSSRSNNHNNSSSNNSTNDNSINPTHQPTSTATTAASRWEENICQVMSHHMSKKTLAYFSTSSSSSSSSSLFVKTKISMTKNSKNKNSNNTSSNNSSDSDNNELINRNAKIFSLYIPSTLRKRIHQILQS